MASHSTAKAIGRAMILPAALIAIGDSATPGAADAQADTTSVTLRIHPRVGDTLVSHVTLVIPGGDLGTPEGTASSAVRRVTIVTARRAIVVRSDSLSVVALMILDSLRGWREDAAHPGTRELVRREGQRLLGAAEIFEDGMVRELTPPPGVERGNGLIVLVTAVPLSRKALRPGSTWEVNTVAPAGLDMYRHRSRKLHYSVRFDSLAARGRLAFVSYTGAVEGDAAPAPLEADSSQLPPDANFLVTGTLRGTIVIDRARDFWSSVDSWTVYRATYVGGSNSKSWPGAKSANFQLTYESVMRNVIVPSAQDAPSIPH